MDKSISKSQDNLGECYSALKIKTLQEGNHINDLKM